jgi:hypothetical protein
MRTGRAGMQLLKNSYESLGQESQRLSDRDAPGSIKVRLLSDSPVCVCI